jgi:hypothetical protein
MKKIWGWILQALLLIIGANIVWHQWPWIIVWIAGIVICRWILYHGVKDIGVIGWIDVVIWPLTIPARIIGWIITWAYPRYAFRWRIQRRTPPRP